LQTKAGKAYVSHRGEERSVDKGREKSVDGLDGPSKPVGPNDQEDENLFVEKYMQKILDYAEKKDKREVLALLMGGLESAKIKLRISVLAIMANSGERLGIFPFDLTTVKCHIKILKNLSVRNPMEFSEDYLKYNILVLGKCVEDLSGLLIEDFKKDDKSIIWKKVISILKFFMNKNREEDTKIGCCRIFLLLVKYQYNDDLIMGDQQLFNTLMKVIQDSAMGLKQLIAEILDNFALNERDYYNRKQKLTISMEYVKQIGSNLTDLLNRYRNPDLVLSILRPLGTLCFKVAYVVN
jgi:hypothetical protein